MEGDSSGYSGAENDIQHNSKRMGRLLISPLVIQLEDGCAARPSTSWTLSYAVARHDCYEGSP